MCVFQFLFAQLSLSNNRTVAGVRTAASPDPFAVVDRAGCDDELGLADGELLAAADGELLAADEACVDGEALALADGAADLPLAVEDGVGDGVGVGVVPVV